MRRYARFENDENYKRDLARERLALERETLLEIQEHILLLARLSAKVYLSNADHEKQGKEWSSRLIPVDLDEDIRLAVVRLNVLVQRVFCADLRNALVDVGIAAAQVGLADSYVQSQEQIELMSDKHLEATELLGSRIRMLFGDYGTKA